ncbi:MAG: hypothetical protein AUI36_33440 [Cyanobacteria bacterium 13_1_40CM_2_61_4]|nr:MAG: hypothetical protein AUI36_33440 [Cyanobacteria bacterium 13_1_40CM_2_61_4]
MFLIMWRLAPAMTLLALGVVPFLMVAIRVFGQSMQARSRERRDLEGHMMALVQQALSALPAARSSSTPASSAARTRRSPPIGGRRRPTCGSSSSLAS